MLKKIFFVFSASLLITFSSHGLPVKHGFISKAEAESLKNVFQQVNPSVVVIVTKESGSSRLKTDKPLIKGGLGSGIVVSNEGLIMTASHVVQMADELNVFFLDGSKVAAKVVSSAQQADVALLKLSYVPDNLQVAEFGDSDQVSIGDEVFIVGAPYGVDHTLTVGYLSGRRTSAGVCDQLIPIEFLQTDASINMGNSGGPMFSMDGKLIGIVSHILSQSGGSEGLGFATTINTAKALLLEQKTFWVGLDVYLVSGELAKALNLPQDAGLLIQRVAKGSPGDKLGFRPGNIPVQIGRQKLLIGGDIVLEVQGMPISVDIKKTCEIRDTMGGLGNEERIDFKVLRGGEIVNLYSSQ